jgi:hypothetical protein
MWRSRRLTGTSRTRIERDLDADSVRRLKATSNADIAIGVLSLPAKRRWLSIAASAAFGSRSIR